MYHAGWLEAPWTLTRGSAPNRPPEPALPGERGVAGAFALLAEMTQSFADAMDLETTLERNVSS